MMHIAEQQVRFNQFGSDNGKLVIYFHGAPGAPEECKIFDQEAKRHGLTFICFDRFSIDAPISGDIYYKLLAEKISIIAAGKKVDFIGFSIGAFVAMQTCRFMDNGVQSLHLISAAAPLESGNYLEAMAGKYVFKLARALPSLFMLLSYWQRFLARFFPNALFHILFVSAVGKDKALAADPEFKSSMIAILRSCFVDHLRGYIRDIVAYVQPWETTLAEISVTTHIWHGTNDNWSPPPMAEDLQSAIPDCNSIRAFSGASHYSCLYESAFEICEILGKK